MENATKSGYAEIKSEYILTDHERTLAVECLSEQDKKELEEIEKSNESNKNKKFQKLNNGQKKLLKGQNKARPNPFKCSPQAELCNSLTDLLESETAPTCTNQKCRFLHNISDYIKAKPGNIGPTCYVYSVRGRCPWGVTCRFGVDHITESGRNIINATLWQEYQEKPKSRNINFLSKDLQFKLRKRKYDFDKSEKVLAKNVQNKDSKQNKSCPLEKQKGEKNHEDTEKKEENSSIDTKNSSSCEQEKMDTETNIATTEDTNLDGNVSAKKEVSSEEEINKSNEKEKEVDEKESKSNVQEIISEVDEGKLNSDSVADVSDKKEGIFSEIDQPIEENTNKSSGCVTDEDVIKTRKEEKPKIYWAGKLYLSPLTTVGNLPFRRMCKDFGVDVTCGEMALATSLLQGVNQEWALVKRHSSEDLFGVQLCGNNPYTMTRCAQLLEEQAVVDFIDINLGCPIDLIYQQGGGSGLMNRDRILGVVVQSMSEVLTVPMTVKLRTGVKSDKNIAHTLVPKFGQWGASLITLHGRTREQRYTRLADWSYIEECAKLAKPTPLFGNGDVLSFEDYETALSDHPSVAGVMIGRGALIKPWIFTEIKERRHWDISSSERFDILKKYVNYGLEHWGSDTKGVENTRRFLLEWLSFLHRYIPVGLLERVPQRMNERPPFYHGRNELETLMSSSNCADWIKISEKLLGPVPDGFHFLPKHKASSWK